MEGDASALWIVPATRNTEQGRMGSGGFAPRKISRATTFRSEGNAPCDCRKNYF